MVRICIEGNIGCGKSTILESLKSLGYHVVPEPIEEWAEWLSNFYSDRKRWSFSFQMKILSSFASEQGAPVSILERSIMSSRFVFAQMLYSQGDMSEKEWELFRHYYDLVSWEPDAIIYIKTTPEQCMERIRKRSRPSEEGITLDYLKKIDFYYTNLLRYCSKSVAVHSVDGSLDSAHVAEHVLQLVQRLVS